MDKVKLSVLIDFLTNKLRCSRRSLAALLNIDKNTITNNANKAICELTPQTRKKVVFLFYIIIKYLPAHDPDAIHEILKTHRYKNYTGEMDSVLSSIQQLKHELETLEYIVQTTRDEYEEQIREQSPVDLEDVTEDLLCA